MLFSLNSVIAMIGSVKSSSNVCLYTCACILMSFQLLVIFFSLAFLIEIFKDFSEFRSKLFGKFGAKMGSSVFKNEVTGRGTYFYPFIK